jgi:two-component system response regulator RegA
MNNAKPALLIIDDDAVFADTLARSIGKRGHQALVANSADQALRLLEETEIDRVVLDMKLGDTSGLKLLPQLLNSRPDISVVILTGYSSISTAVEAIKLGATNYICKPCDADEVLLAFERTVGDPQTELPANPPSVNRLEWEHIQRVLRENHGNISATARSLGMHRRTLQRKLQKKPQAH